MKRLTLVRHAKSSWDEVGLADRDRPLNARGQRDAPLMAGVLHKLGRQPDLLVSSPALRARKTAECIAQGLGYSMESIVLDERIYDTEVEQLWGIVREWKTCFKDVMVFGHYPWVSDLARELTNDFSEHVVTTGVVEMELSIQKWSEVRPGCGKLTRYLYPKLFKKA